MSAGVVEMFLSPLAGLLADPTVSEIMVNPGPRVFVERGGALEEASDVHLTEKQLQAAVRILARSVGLEADAKNPLLEARLRDGLRVAGRCRRPRSAA